MTLAGRQVRQEGVALATTTTRTRGTIHLLNSVPPTPRAASCWRRNRSRRC
ncbi:hypothetical protein WJ970_24855 [Achromobacter xylosoxidans]